MFGVQAISKDITHGLVTAAYIVAAVGPGIAPSVVPCRNRTSRTSQKRARRTKAPELGGFLVP